jgi:hypothetical protein
MHAFRITTIDDYLHLQCLHWICHGGCPIFMARVISKSYRGRSNGVLRRVKVPIECGPSAIPCVLSPLVGVPSGTSKTYRSLLLAVSSSTINKPSGYIMLKLLLLRSPQAPLLVTQLVRCGSLRPRNNGQEAKYHCSKDSPFSLSIYLFSFAFSSDVTHITS